jgi:hypothetical protein
MRLPISALIVTSSKYIIRINKPTREDSGAITTATAVHSWSRAHKSVFNFITSSLKLCPQSSMSNIKTLIPYNTGLSLTAIQLKPELHCPWKTCRQNFLQQAGSHIRSCACMWCFSAAPSSTPHKSSKNHSCTENFYVLIYCQWLQRQNLWEYIINSWTCSRICAQKIDPQ